MLVGCETWVCHLLLYAWTGSGMIEDRDFSPLCGDDRPSRALGEPVTAQLVSCCGPILNRTEGSYASTGPSPALDGWQREPRGLSSRVGRASERCVGGTLTGK